MAKLLSIPFQILCPRPYTLCTIMSSTKQLPFCFIKSSQELCSFSQSTLGIVAVVRDLRRSFLERLARSHQHLIAPERGRVKDFHRCSYINKDINHLIIFK